MKAKAKLNELDRRFAPKYVDLAQRLLRDITSRGLKPGDLLGTEEELGIQHGLSRATVRQALAMLERDGVIRRRRAKGTFVGPAVDAVDPHLVRGTALIVASNEQSIHINQDFAFATVLRAVERELGREGFSVQIMGIGESAADDRQRLARLTRHEGLQGVCVIGSCLEPYRSLLPELPVVTSCTFYPLPGPWVGQNVRDGADTSVRYLLDHGHRDIALICSGAIDQRAFGGFVEGYLKAHREAGVNYSRQHLYHAYYGESLSQLAMQVLSSDKRPTAIMAENWHVCETIIAAANALNLRIPQDISLIGYGQNALQVAGPVAITSFVPDGDRIGQTLAQLLTQFVDQKNMPDQPVFIPGRLVERDSVQAL